MGRFVRGPGIGRVFVSLDSAPQPRQLRAGAWAWLYLGNDYERYARVRARLDGVGREIHAGPLINAVADTFRDELLNFDAVLDVRDELGWQSTDLAERNVFTSAFLHGCCGALAVYRAASDLDEDLLVVVEDSLLRWRIGELARGLGRDGRTAAERAVGALRLARARVAWKAHGIAHRLLYLRNFRRHRRTLRALGPRVEIPTDLDTLLVAWAAPDTFAASGERTYIGDVPSVLRDERQRMAFLAIPTSWVHPLESILESIREARDPVVVPEQLLRPRDALAIAFGTLRSPARPARRFVVDGLDLTGFVADGLRHDWARPRQLWARQFFHVGRAVARTTRPRTVIHPFEHQPWEKALGLGVRAGSPETTVVGFQHTPISNRWFPYFPSRRDVAAGALPDQVVVVGEFWRRLFAEHGYPAHRLVVAPALRYSHLGEVDLRARRGHAVLVAGSIGRSDTLELFVKALEALEPLPGISLILKPHPFMGDVEGFVEAALAAAGMERLPPHVEIVEGSVADALPGVGVVLYNTTSVSYEALAAGIPVLFVESDFWFDLDPVPPDAGVGSAAREPAEIRAAVRRLLDEGVADSEARLAHAGELLADTLATGDAGEYARLVERAAS